MSEHGPEKAGVSLPRPDAMKVTYSRPVPEIPPEGQLPPHLHLEPESDADRRVLERLLADDGLAGHGRDSHTMRIIHAQIILP